MKMMQQLNVVSDNLHLVTWVEFDPKIEVGSKITLKDYKEPDRLWEVLLVGQSQKASDIKRGWDNNI